GLVGPDLAGYHIASNADVQQIEADWVADPDAGAGQVRAVLAFAGVTATPMFDRVVSTFVDGTAREARRARSFQPAEFGLSRRELTSRFALYRARYGV
ncbi:hypothetical protein ABZ369_36605, partial [Streptomyces sp. NPDC005918]